MKASSPFPKISIEGFSTREASKLLNVLPKIIRVLGITDPLEIKKGEIFRASKRKSKLTRRLIAHVWSVPSSFFFKEDKDAPDNFVGELIILAALDDHGASSSKVITAWEKGTPNAFSI